MRNRAILLALACSLFFALPGGTGQGEARELTFDGGPSGGTYTLFAKGLAELWQSRIPRLEITVSPSGGSVANLIGVEEGEIDMAIVSAGDLAEGVRGRLEEHPSPPVHLRAVARLFGEYAHLAVLDQTPVHKPADLAGKRVAVGALGSGTYSAARRFFTTLEMWDRIRPEYASFDLINPDFLSGRVQAVWQMVGYPSRSLVSICEKTPVRLIDLGRSTAETPLLTSFPYYAPGIIPAGTYPGQKAAVSTFQDQAVLVVSKKFDPLLIHQMLMVLFSPEGLRHMQGVHPSAKELDRRRGRPQLPIPYHPGAERFWAGRP